MITPRISRATGWALWLCAPVAIAEDASMVGTGLQAMVGLGIVLALIVVGSVLLKHVFPRRLGRHALLKSIATMAVGPRERVVVIELADTWMVVGVTATQITPLHVTPKGNLPDSAGAPDSIQNANATPFKRLLARMKEH